MGTYCKKCGAIVVGKFCSCCGERVRTSLKEYRIMERRLKKVFEDSKREDFQKYGLVPIHVASLAFFAAERKCEPKIPVNEETFDLYAEQFFCGLKQASREAESLYQKILAVIYESGTESNDT